MKFPHGARRARPRLSFLLPLAVVLLSGSLPLGALVRAAESDDYFCGTDWLDAAATCSLQCPDDDACRDELGAGFSCFPFTGCREKIDAGEMHIKGNGSGNGIGNNSNGNGNNGDGNGNGIQFANLGDNDNYCGRSWGAVRPYCAHSCPGKSDAECVVPGERCFAATGCNQPLVPLVADLLVTLLGASSTMEDEDGDILGGTIRDLLSEAVTEEGVALDGVELGEQALAGRRELRRRHEGRGLGGWHEDENFAENWRINKANGVARRVLPTGSSALDVSMVVTGEYRPPPYLDLNVIAEDSINRQGGRVVSDLRDRGARAGRSFFESVDGIEAVPRSVATRRPTGEPVRSPTLSPSVGEPELPSFPPSAFPTEFPTPSPTRSYDQVIQAGTVEDLELGGTTTSSFGFIFNLRTRPGTGVVLVNGLEFYTESTAHEKFELWTRLGSFKDHKGYYDRWDRIASGTVKGHGIGKYTAIPDEAFTPVSIPGGGGEGGTRAFYLTLEEKKLVYKIGVGMTEVGTPASDAAIQLSNDDLEVWEGEGVLSYPFATLDRPTFYRFPRAFLGTIHYDRMPCKPFSAFGLVTELPCPAVPTGSPIIPPPTATPVTSPPSISPTAAPVRAPTLGPTGTPPPAGPPTAEPTTPVPTAEPTTAEPTPAPVVPMRANVVSTFRNVPDRRMTQWETEKFLQIVTEFLRRRTGKSMVIDGIDLWHHRLTLADADKGSVQVSRGANRGTVEKRNGSERNRQRNVKENNKGGEVVPQVMAVEITMILRISLALLPEDLLGGLAAAAIDENQSELLSLLNAESAFYSYFKEMDGIQSRAIERVTGAPTLGPTTLAQYLASQEEPVTDDEAEAEAEEGREGFIIFVGLGVGALWCFLTVVSISYLMRRRAQMQEENDMEDLLRQETSVNGMGNIEKMDEKKDENDYDEKKYHLGSTPGDQEDPSRTGGDVSARRMKASRWNSGDNVESSVIAHCSRRRIGSKKSFLTVSNLKGSSSHSKRSVPVEDGDPFGNRRSFKKSGSFKDSFRMKTRRKASQAKHAASNATSSGGHASGGRGHNEFTSVKSSTSASCGDASSTKPLASVVTSTTSRRSPPRLANHHHDMGRSKSTGDYSAASTTSRRYLPSLANDHKGTGGSKSMGGSSAASASAR